MQNQLTESHVGRILLHLACACLDQKYAWHWHGACRELALPFGLRRAQQGPHPGRGYPGHEPVRHGIPHVWTMRFAETVLNAMPPSRERGLWETGTAAPAILRPTGKEKIMNMPRGIARILKPTTLAVIGLAAAMASAQQIPSPYPQAFPLGTLTINCTVYSGSLVRSSYTTKDLLQDLERDLGVSFPAGATLEVSTTPYLGWFSGMAGFFPVYSSGATVMVTSTDGRSWDVSPYVQVQLPPLTTPLIFQGLGGDNFGTPSAGTLMFMGALHFSDNTSSIDVKGPVNFACKSVLKPATSSNLAVSTTALMTSGSGAGTLRGNPVIMTGKLLITGKSVWNLSYFASLPN